MGILEESLTALLTAFSVNIHINFNKITKYISILSGFNWIME